MIVVSKSGNGAPEEVMVSEVNGLSLTIERYIVPLNFEIRIPLAYKE